MYGKAPKMATKQPKMAPAKKPSAPKLPVRGQRTMTNNMTRGKK